ncbi:MAG TPA: acetyl/propionyl/methylcrotonyl-CoA carboxylase subunit alpha [Caulobacteraceae bacterium]|jgi:propionyl-CoA carboxylase alpha chain
MFSKILIANRGEIAVRIIKTARRLGIGTVQVYSDADASSLAVEMADEAVRIGPPPAAQSYLLTDRIVEAAKATGAEAIHPGFGFLSENAAFARRLEAEGIVFIGPNPRAIDAMGDKIESKRFAAAANVSTVPGHLGVIEGVDHAIQIAEEIGYPVMMKASAGGGGKGMRIAWNRADVEEGFPAAQAEARNSFGDDRVFIEKFVTTPRHIEIQVLGDKHGKVLHLNERECSIQRRNQKVIEEAPSPFLDEATRAAMGAQAVALARAVDYDSAGTVEFIVDAERNFYFLEMNTRLQVEHPVTELTTGVDLVEQMIRSAAGEPLSLTQPGLAPRGWAIESRIYAEDPYRGFLPSIGRLARYLPPKEGERGAYVVRNDAGVREGDEISMFYDPMIAKLCTWGESRAAAVEGMAEALDDFLIEGVGHNIPFLSAVMDQPRFREGRLTTGYIAEEFPGGFHGTRETDEQRYLMGAAGAYMHWLQHKRRNNGLRPLRHDWVVVVGEGYEERLARFAPGPEGLEFFVESENRTFVLDQVDWRPGQALFSARLDGRRFTVQVRPAAEGFVVRHRAATARVLVLSPRSAELHHKLPKRQAANTAKLVVSPMPGLVVSIAVAPGQEVRSGEAVAVIEAMKMQNIIRAETDGVVKAVNTTPGASVAADEVLVEFA